MTWTVKKIFFLIYLRVSLDFFLFSLSRLGIDYLVFFSLGSKIFFLDFKVHLAGKDFHIISQTVCIYLFSKIISDTNLSQLRDVTKRQLAAVGKSDFAIALQRQPRLEFIH
jgi:hypothetical protein